jgi:hypothetical protein
MSIAGRLIPLIATVCFTFSLSAQQKVPGDECVRTAGMQVFSNVFVHKETGDLLGYDLAIRRNTDSSVDAFLYVYEGGGSDSGIPLSGKILENQLSVQGTWVEHLVEYPSKKETVQKHFVKIVGTLNSEVFSGELTIDNLQDHTRIRLKHVKKIWSCNN